MSAETDSSIDWITEVCKSIGPMVWEEEHPGDPEAIVIVRNQDGVLLTSSRKRVWKDIVLGVKGVVEGDLERAKELAREIDARLQRRANERSTYGCTIYSCVGEGDIGYPEYFDSRTFWHRGGLYRLKVRKEG